MAATPDDATETRPVPPARAGGGDTGSGAPGGRGGPGRSAPGGRGDGAPPGRESAGSRAGRPGAPGPRRAPLALAAAVTTGWAALVSFAPVLAAVLLAHVVDGAGAPVGRLSRLALAGWLLAHGVPLDTGIGPVALAPLAISALAGWRVVRAGVHTTRAIGGRRSGSPRLALLVGLAVAIAYALLGAGAAAFATTPGLGVPVARSALTLGVFGLVAGLVGALRETRVLARLARRTPVLVRDAVRTGLVAAVLILAAGAAAVGTAVAVAGGSASQMLAAYHTGVAGQAGLTLLCALYGPNLSVWAASYLVGPGFAVGAGTTVSAARVSLGALPAVPVLAGLPTRPASGWGGLLLGVPLAAGMAAGWLLARRRLRAAAAGPTRASAGLLAAGAEVSGASAGVSAAGAGVSRSGAGVSAASAGVSAGARLSGSGAGPSGADAGGGTDAGSAPDVAAPRSGGGARSGAAPRWGELLAGALLAGPVTGLALAGAGTASRGSLGAGRLAEVGPAVWQTAGTATLLVAAGAVVAAAATKALIGVRRGGEADPAPERRGG